MKTFTIENETNNIIAHATKREASEVPNAESFSSPEQLAKLAANWQTARLVEIWNSLPGATTVKNFNDRKKAVARIWKNIQSLGESIPTEAAVETETPTQETSELGTAPSPEAEAIEAKPDVGASDQKVAAQDEKVQPTPAASEVEAEVSAQSPDVAAAAEKATEKATRKTKTPTDETTPKTPREASKTSQVIAMLKREGGTTVEELMASMGWLKHTTRAMLSAGGSLTKKHGLVVTSEKVGDKRIYFIKG